MKKKNQSERRKNSISSKVKKALCPPGESFANPTQLEILSNREVYLEGCRSILEYDDNVIRVSAKKMQIRFTGKCLTVKNLTPENIVIQGVICSVEFLT